MDFARLDATLVPFKDVDERYSNSTINLLVCHTAHVLEHV